MNSDEEDFEFQNESDYEIEIDDDDEEEEEQEFHDAQPIQAPQSMRQQAQALLQQQVQQRQEAAQQQVQAQQQYNQAIAGVAGPGGRGGIFGGRGIHPGAFQAGFGGHAFARPPPEAFRGAYRAYSTAMLEVQQGRTYGGRSNLMYGGKIVMPPSALNELTQLDIELPINFQITNPAIPTLSTHGGVLEFIAAEGTVNLPQWMMDQLRLEEGSPVRIWGARFPKGKMIKIQAQSVDFLEVSDPKAVLEQALRNYSCLSAGDIIEIGYQSLQFRFLIMEITPPGPAISVIDTDLEVDFDAPLGYIEPEYKPRSAAPTMKDKFVIDTTRKVEVDARGSGTSTPVPGTSGGAGGGGVFEGMGNSLSGKRVKGRGTKVKKIEAVEEDSKIFRTDQTRIITSDIQIGGRQVPAALILPFGNLFFGFDNLIPAPGSAEELALKAAANHAANVPFATVGSGNTLSGRARGAPLRPSPVATPPPTTTSGKQEEGEKKPFGGMGQSLSGKKVLETIVID